MDKQLQMEYVQERTIRCILIPRKVNQNTFEPYKISVAQVNQIDGNIFKCSICQYIIDFDASQCLIHDTIYCSECKNRCCDQTQRLNSRLSIILEEIQIYCERCEIQIKYSQFSKHVQEHKLREKCPNNCQHIFEENESQYAVQCHQIQECMEQIFKCEMCQITGNRCQIFKHNCCVELKRQLLQQKKQKLQKTSLGIFLKFNRNINSKENLLQLCSKITQKYKNKSLKTTKFYELIWTLISRNENGFEYLNNLEDILSDGKQLILVKKNKITQMLELELCKKSKIGEQKHLFIQSFTDKLQDLVTNSQRINKCQGCSQSPVHLIQITPILNILTEYLFQYQLKVNLDFTSEQSYEQWIQYYKQNSNIQYFCDSCKKKM